MEAKSPDIFNYSYYEPDKDEFHIGFNFEVLSLNRNGVCRDSFIKLIYSETSNLNDYLKIRVRYLCCEEFIDEGFDFNIINLPNNPDYIMYDFIKTYKKEYSGHVNGEKQISYFRLHVHYDPTTKFMLISTSINLNEKESTLPEFHKTKFAGYVNNINEFRKLLKQIDTK